DQAPTGKITIAQSAEPANLDLLHEGAVTRESVFGNVYEPLVEIDVDGSSARPVLATSWERTSPDTWVFELRDGVKFHNGEDFNATVAAANLNYHIQRVADDKPYASSTFPVYKAAEALPDGRLQVQTNWPDQFLPQTLLWVQIYPLSVVEAAD